MTDKHQKLSNLIKQFDWANKINGVPIESASLINVVFNNDCMNILKELPDNFFDLAVIDPPYGMNLGKMNMGKGSLKQTKSRGKVDYTIDHYGFDWDSSAPQLEYFTELFRVSKVQVLWGANYYINRLVALLGENANSSSWIWWDKATVTNDFADGEMAWTNLGGVARQFTFKWSGFLQGDMKNKEVKIHPTQKPVALYHWILNKFGYIDSDDIFILDTHLGSGSSRIAAHKNKVNFVGIELDETYYQKHIDRFADYLSANNTSSMFDIEIKRPRKKLK